MKISPTIPVLVETENFGFTLTFIYSDITDQEN